ncbi:hypothetical protein niasHS_003591 [Heterodera schachtii]|uniref:Frizzled-4 n=1 Tax=Heterodera schachtii TaxID=97005 RepID=A0ABD2KGY9_HETSC
MALFPLLLLFPLFLCSSAALSHLSQLGNSPPRQSSIFERVKAPLCHPIDISLCRDIPYNRTILPNPFIDGLDPQSLQAQTEHFKPLIRTKCSPHILFFICSVFVPMCPAQLPQAVTSCRSVCEEVRHDCIKIFHEFDFPWPAVLNCSRFPASPELCMRPEPTTPEPFHSLAPANRKVRVPECPQDLVDLDPADPTAKCAFRCEKSTMFRKDLKEKARVWLMMCAFLNVCVASFAVFSFCIGRRRFAFSERSVCFLALCSLLSSLPHLLRSLFGFDAIACVQLPSGPKFLLLDGPNSAGAFSGISPLPSLCFFSFLLHFYFSLAASMWWLMLTFTWYLSAARKWAEEAIGRHSVQLHLLAWTVPAILAAFVLWTDRIDASELSGLCSVGNADQSALLWLWTVPRSSSALLGLYLILAGFSAMCKERNHFRKRGTDTSKLEKFMFKMGVFALLFVFPSLIASACDLHQLSVLIQWLPHTVGCKSRGGAFSGECVRPEQPPGQLQLLGATMELTAGMASGLWMLSPKTLNSWKRALPCGRTADKGTERRKDETGMRMAEMERERRGTDRSGASGGGAGREFALSRLSSPPHHPNIPSHSSPHRPLLLPADLPPLPPPPPTAVPSSTVTNGGFSYRWYPTMGRNEVREEGF